MEAVRISLKVHYTVSNAEISVELFSEYERTVQNLNLKKKYKEPK